MNKKYLIVSNENKDPGGNILKNVTGELIAHNASYEVFDEKAGNAESTENGDFDAIIVLGGDGTIMRTVSKIKSKCVRIFGINTGTTGFLTGAEIGDIKNAIRCLLNNEYITEKRMMLDVFLNDSPLSTVFNDVVVTRNGYSRIIRLEVKINDISVLSVSGDGIILATPTGSTGYSLSAGGSICAPESKMILITPICSHSLNGRPIIASDTDVVSVELLPERNTENVDLGVTLDGQSFIKLAKGDKITVKRSERYVELIKTDKKTFFETLTHKLS